MKSHIDKFLALRCAPDVLECVNPLKNTERNITEAMLVVEAIRPRILKERGKWKVVDVNAGNPFLGLLIAHLLPVELVTSMSWRYPKDQKLDLSKVQHFQAKIAPLEFLPKQLADVQDSILVSASPNFDVAVELATTALANDLPLAMVPARIKGRQVRNSKSDCCDEVYQTYLDWLVRLSGGKAQYRRWLPNVNDGLVTRAL